MTLRSRPVCAGFALRADLQAPNPAPEVLARVAALWRAEKTLRPALFDGVFFSVSRLEDDRAEGFLAPYSWRLAQLRDPNLRRELRLGPLDVSCLSLCSGRAVFGRRSPRLAVDGGLWELCPSGTVHGGFRRPDGGLDPLAHAAQETREELGLKPDPDCPGHLFALIENLETGVLDLGVALDLPVQPEELLHRHREYGDGEYDALTLVPLDEARAFAHALGPRLAPVSRALLEQYLRQASKA